ncbi:hypothetical protein, partial [Pseudonocardia sp. ICBG1293]|uniref:hypothetical protein n=1 Tax=Pseudonocardia sp. ICBG1293 TaxID=2844382 RepID=UPI0035A8ECED
CCTWRSPTRTPRTPRRSGTPAAGGVRPGAALLEYARGRVRSAQGRHRDAVEQYMGCADGSCWTGGAVNPVLAPWRSAAATSLLACGAPAAAHRMAADELRLALPVGRAGPVAVAEAVLAGLDADPTVEEPGGDGVTRAARP